MKKNYKTPMSNLAGAAILLVALLMSFSAAEALAADPPDNAYGLRAADVFRCGEGTVTITATWNESITDFDQNNIRWYEQPFYGEHIHTGATFETPFLELSKTYFIDYIYSDGGQEECGICDRIAVRANISYEVIENRISYEANFFCQTVGTYTPTIAGIRGGTFRYVSHESETGNLVIDANTGVINPESSDLGHFEIFYDPPVVPGCPTTPATWDITITEPPVNTGISYANPQEYCAFDDAGTKEVSFTETGYVKPDNAFFSASPSGLSINPNDGKIDLALSQTGEYTVTYTVPGGGGCPPVFAHTEVKIERLPVADINYGGPFCGDLNEDQLPDITGNTNGTFDGPTGLTINSSTGVITPNTSTAGIYTVTYTIPASDICPEVIVEVAIEILPALVATVSATTTEVFAVIDPDVVVTFEGTTSDAPFTFFYRIGDDTSQLLEIASDATGVATVTQLTTVPGTYTYTLVSVTDNNDCSAEVIDQSVVITVNPTPVAEFSYPNTPYCQDSGIATPTFEGQVGNFTYSSTTSTITIDDNGDITLATSDPGTYEVTNTVEGDVSHTTEITITETPNPDFTYAKDSFCPGTDEYAAPTFTDTDFEGKGVFTANSAALVFATVTGTVTPGTIDVNASFPGQYSITYTLPASGGCAEVYHTIDITIDTPPRVISPRDYIICSGEEVQIGFESDPPGATFEWRVTSIDSNISGASLDNNGTTTAGNNTITFTLTNSSVTEPGEMLLTVTPTVADAGDCSTGPAVEVVVTVRPIPELSSTLTPPTICSGVLFEYTPTSEHEAASFSWSRAAVTGIDEAANDGSGTVSETLTNNTYAPVTVTYVYTTTADGCSSDENVVVTVNPLGQVGTVTDVAVCYNTVIGPFDFTTDNTGGTTTYTWTNDNEDIGLAAGGTDNISTFTVTNTTSATITATITVTPSFDNAGTSCVGASVSFTITVYPPPATPTTVYDNNTRTEGYTGEEFTVTATTTTSGATIKWYTDADGTTTTTAPTGTETGTYTAWAEAEHDVTGCISTERIKVTLIINESPQ